MLESVTPRTHRVATRLLGSALALLVTACGSLPDEELPARRVVVEAPQASPPAPAADSTAGTATTATPPEQTPEKAAAAAAAPPTPAGIGPERYADLFDRIRAGFQLDDPEQRQIDVQLQWYAGNPEYLERVFGRSELYLHHIVAEVERRGMPLEIALLPVVESAFEPYAYSRARAAGLWQFIPGTGERFGLKQNWWYDGRRDVIESTRAALDYLQYMHDEFNGDWLLAVAGYNCGEGNVARAIRENRNAGRPIDFWSLRLPAETRAYVPKLLAMKRLIADPEVFGLAFSPIANEPYFAAVDVGTQIDLKLAAELAGVTHDELFELNSAYHRWATPPDGPHRLLLPIDASDTLRQNAAQLTPDELLRVTHHEVRKGDTLASVATRYKTQPSVLRALNTLGNGPLVIGSDLRVPSGVTALPEKVARAAARVDGRGRDNARGGRRPVIHVVRRGDSLWTIARRNHTDVKTLMALNGMQPGETLRAGERLVVNKAASSSSRSASSSGGGSRSVRYTVRRGDTLYRIARQHGVTVAQLVSWNGFSASAPLRPGQKITINLSRRR